VVREQYLLVAVNFLGVEGIQRRRKKGLEFAIKFLHANFPSVTIKLKYRRTIIYIMIICNCSACLRRWYLNLIGETSFEYQNANGLNSLYINNLYFSVLTFVTVGYGDMSATNLYDKFFVCLMMVNINFL
jgi:hypothetical protein